MQYADGPLNPAELDRAADARVLGYWAMTLGTMLFAGLSIACAVASDGFLEADACTHYMYARFAFQEPHYFVNLWGRPLVTGLYAVPAVLGGVLGVRLTSLALALLCGWVAYRLARAQHYRWPALAFVFTLAQPLVFLHSFSELTELPFAALIVLAFWAYRARQFALMAFLVGLGPLGRPEGFGFIGMAAVALVLHRKWYWLPLLAVPLIAWNHAGWEIYDRGMPWWRWLPSQWPWAQDSVYPSGHPLHFVALMPVVTSPLIFPAACIGAWRSLAAGWPPARFFKLDHETRCQVLIAAIPLLILVGHSVLYALGKMASNGELRYLLVVAPFWALLSAKGWEWVFERFEWRGVLRWAGVAALLPALANHFLYTVVPLRQTEDWRRAKAVAEWYQGEPGLRERYPRLLASHPGIYYYLDLSFTDRRHVVEWLTSNVESPPAGTLLVWDPVYGVFNADQLKSIKLDAIRANGWVPRRLSIPGFYDLSESDLLVLNRLKAGPSLSDSTVGVEPAQDDFWHLFLSPRDVGGNLTAPPAE